MNPCGLYLLFTEIVDVWGNRLTQEEIKRNSVFCYLTKKAIAISLVKIS